jgi:hypothetical protein
LPPNRAPTTFTALARKSLTRTGISASSSRRRPGAASRQSRPSSQSPGRKPTREQAQLGAGEEHDLGSQPAEPLDPFGTVAEEIQQLLSRLTTSGSNGSRVLVVEPEPKKPVS